MRHADEGHHEQPGRTRGPSMVMQLRPARARPRWVEDGNGNGLPGHWRCSRSFLARPAPRRRPSGDGEGGTIAIQATTMPPCRRSRDDVRPALRTSSIEFRTRRLKEHRFADVGRKEAESHQRQRTTRACSSAGQSASLTTTRSQVRALSRPPASTTGQRGVPPSCRGRAADQLPPGPTWGRKVLTVRLRWLTRWRPAARGGSGPPPGTGDPGRGRGGGAGSEPSLSRPCGRETLRTRPD